MLTRTILAIVLALGTWTSTLSAAPPPDHFNVPVPPSNQFFISDEMDPFDGQTMMFVAGEERDETQEGTAWLGLQLGPVPASLASHLGLGEKGLLVRNVFEGSPADKAGIQRYDVLMHADDADVVGTVEAFSKAIRSRKAGDTLHLTIIRSGKELKQDIQLGESPRPQDLTPKYPEEPDVLYRKDFGLRGRIFRPGPSGWQMEDLGELPDFEQMLREKAPSPLQRLLRQGTTDHARRVGKGGESIDVRRQKDGAIEVRRERRTTTGPADEKNSAHAEVKVYPNMDELRKADPEAADLLEHPQPPREPRGRTWEMPVPPRERGPNADRGPDRRPAPPPVPDERWREWRDRFFQGPFGPGEAERPAPPPPGREGPGVRFEAQPDGKITVHKRERDAELSVTYANRDEFKQKAPELYRQFEDLEKTMK